MAASKFLSVILVFGEMPKSVANHRNSDYCSFIIIIDQIQTLTKEINKMLIKQASWVYMEILA